MLMDLNIYKNILIKESLSSGKCASMPGPSFLVVLFRFQLCSTRKMVIIAGLH